MFLEIGPHKSRHSWNILTTILEGGGVLLPLTHPPPPDGSGHDPTPQAKRSQASPPDEWMSLT